MKKINVLLVCLIFIALLAIGCSGTMQTESVEPDLYNQTEENSSTNSTSDEDEVLRLLGLDEQDDMEKTVVETTPQNSDDLEEKILSLEQAISDKNLQVENLKAELAEKNEQLNNMQENQTREATVVVPKSNASFAAQYEQALGYYNNRKYRVALQMFDDLLASNDKHDLLDNCQYWKGECYYGLGEFNQAIIEFEKVFIYSNSNKYDDAQLKLGLCYTQLGNNAKARAEFEKLLNNYPNSEYVGKANSYLSRF